MSSSGTQTYTKAEHSHQNKPKNLLKFQTKARDSLKMFTIHVFMCLCTWAGTCVMCQCECRGQSTCASWRVHSPCWLGSLWLYPLNHLPGLKFSLDKHICFISNSTRCTCFSLLGWLSMRRPHFWHCNLLLSGHSVSCCKQVGAFLSPCKRKWLWVH